MPTDEQLRDRLEAMAGRKCLPEGELHVCWLIEQTFDGTRKAGDYAVELKHVIAPVPPRGLVGDFRFANALWQQRTEAILKVNGEFDK